MAVSSRTKPGTRKLSDVARHVIQPEGIVSSGYAPVEAKCRDLGIVHDDWQQGLCRLMLGKRKDGKFAATVGGVVMSIPRQVGKTFTVGSVIFALCILFPRLTVLWTAHHTRTSDETFQSMYALSLRRKVAPHIAARRRANGQQEIRFRNGSRILFGAREQGFGRGFAEVDIEVFDEAQILNATALEDMVAATNQAKHPAGALLFYMGTPPRPKDPGEVFRNKRAKALAGKSTDMVYVELGADPDADPDDRAQWAKANPSYPARTPLESMQRLRENVGSDESWFREGLGVWDETTAATWEVMPEAAWLALGKDLKSSPLDPVAFGFDVNPERTSGSIAVSGANKAGLAHVETIAHEGGVDWIVEVLARASLLHKHIAVVTDANGPAAALIPALARRGVKVTALGGQDVARACAGFFDAAENARLSHRMDAEITAALAAARKTTTPEGAYRWSRRDLTTDISALYAATFAVFGHASAAPPRKFWGAYA